MICVKLLLLVKYYMKVNLLFGAEVLILGRGIVVPLLT
jgi:hypothetical protein